MSDLLYQIYWTNKLSGMKGVGPKQFSLEEATTLCAELNEDYPGIQHVVIPAGQSKPEKAPEPETPVGVFVAMTDSSPMPFGVHKDKPMGQVPSTYLDFLLAMPWINQWPAVKDYILRNHGAINQDLERRERA